MIGAPTCRGNTGPQTGQRVAPWADHSGFAELAKQPPAWSGELRSARGQDAGPSRGSRHVEKTSRPASRQGMPGNHLGRPEPLPWPRSLLAMFDEHSHLATGGLLAVGGQLPHLQFTRWSFPTGSCQPKNCKSPADQIAPKYAIPQSDIVSTLGPAGSELPGRDRSHLPSWVTVGASTARFGDRTAPRSARAGVELRATMDPTAARTERTTATESLGSGQPWLAGLKETARQFVRSGSRRRQALNWDRALERQTEVSRP